ncbi:tail protein [Maribacter phage Molly_5]|uniref:Tail protein n=2 Tax=Mollyvirus TaxID=2948826 RepID=A0A8E4XVR1_9CAUD|nr:tail protein [Maribacter phage Molly_1]YP_010357331.1 tail protein [Maribacter phage Colly_1]QQO97771.1 tail protein [Maribacter phage Molly_2]QQO97971.1 tail protein [Maribacter phage Molly_3]QQO98171.1 tail protein [Maribacter phage Molly_4]QQO98371.1 tail protein [Maribacter phage Molly_5]QQO97369.1 tail protein [Maribacter phage Colly_1]
MRPQVIETTTNLMTANLFTFEFVGVALNSPNFNRVEGANLMAETVEHPDGGTGIIRKFHGGTVRAEDISIVRVRDNTQNDLDLYNMVRNYLVTGQKRDGLMVKRQFGKIIRRIEFEGLNTSAEQLPSYDNGAAAGEEITYACQVDWYEELFTGLS